MKLRIACVERKCNCGENSQKLFKETWREFFPKLAQLAQENSERRVQVRLFETVHGKKEQKQITEDMPAMLDKLFSKIDEGLAHNNLSHNLILQVNS